VDISSRRTASPFQSALAAFPGPLRPVAPGASSYFTAPTDRLDPHLFERDETLRPQVQDWLLRTIHTELQHKGFSGSTRWLRVWIAGSGASYQWSAARDPGDLDVLLGVDYTRFREANIVYTGLSDREISDDINEALQADLWKRTANQELGGARYEVTWYVNPGSTDIRDINPYAAFDVGRQEWTVRPIDLPKAGPGEWFPKEWDDQARLDNANASLYVEAYNQAAHDAATATGPAWLNAATRLNSAGKAAVALFDEIHQGRHAAFDEQGQGYRDFANYRWQRGKQLGHIQALRAIKDATKEARLDAEQRLYGGELKSTEHVLTAAALRRDR
jgi:hypothetical protein